MKLISLNIEGNKHLERVLPFLKKEDADVISLQEIFESDLHLFEALGYKGTFLPMTILEISGAHYKMGVAIFSRVAQENIDTFYYSNEQKVVPVFNRDDRENTIMHGVILSECVVDGQKFRIGTTHFTWTPIGERPSEHQASDLDSFLEKIQHYPPHVMCGDFNIPRNISRLYSKLIQNYTDSVPAEYLSSLDMNLHHLGATPDALHLFETFMVDYVFSQPPYVTTHVRLEFGVSDHAAVIATIE